MGANIPVFDENELNKLNASGYKDDVNNERKNGFAIGTVVRSNIMNAVLNILTKSVSAIFDVLDSAQEIDIDSNKESIKNYLIDGLNKYINSKLKLTSSDAKVSIQIDEEAAKEITVNNVQHATNADNATNSTNAINATNADNASKATNDSSGRNIIDTYETKTDSNSKLTEAKNYTDTQISAIQLQITSLGEYDVEAGSSKDITINLETFNKLYENQFPIVTFSNDGNSTYLVLTTKSEVENIKLMVFSSFNGAQTSAQMKFLQITNFNGNITSTLYYKTINYNN